MGVLEHERGTRVVLRPIQVVGRSSQSHPCLQSSAVSSSHASIRYTRGRWLVRDLGSRNGTWVSGERLTDASWRELREGDCLQFACSEERWWFVDASMPGPAATSGELRAETTGELLVLPSTNTPEVCITYSTNGGRDGWRMDRDGEWVDVADGQQIECGGRSWSLVLPEVPHPTEQTDTTPGELLLLSSFVLEFDVSRNEETVSVDLVSPHARISLPERAFHYLLLLLARARLRDMAAGLEPRAAGWIARDDLVDRLGTSPEALNVDIHRARRQFGEAGVKDAAEIVERRRGAAELRLGTDAVVVRDT